LAAFFPGRQAQTRDELGVRAGRRDARVLFAPAQLAATLPLRWLPVAIASATALIDLIA
jgi:hypothetical protein